MPKCVYKNCTLKCSSVGEHCAKYATMRERKEINYPIKSIKKKSYKHNKILK